MQTAPPSPTGDDALRALLSLALQSNDGVAIKAAIEAIKLNEEGKKLHAEAAKLSEEGKLVRNQSNVDRYLKIAQAVTPVGLILTVLLQAFQIWSTQRSQAAVEESASWRDGLKAYMAASPQSSASEAFFQSHLSSKQYGPVARQMLLEELPRTSSTSLFKNLFAMLFPNASNSELAEMVSVDRDLYIEESSLRNSALKADTQFRYMVTNNITELGDQLGLRLKTRIDGPLDLRWTEFMDSKFAGANLRDARLDGAVFSNVDLTGANLCNATSDDRLYLGNTNWWDASGISKDLLRYLSEKTKEAAQKAQPVESNPPATPQAPGTEVKKTESAPPPASNYDWQYAPQMLHAFQAVTPKTWTALAESCPSGPR